MDRSTLVASVFRAFGRFAQLKQLCRTGERGVFKRIDENRELLELLQSESPDLLRRCPWVEGWIESQDRFLVDLARLVHAGDQPDLEGRRCRPWPGREGLADRARLHLETALKRRRT